MTLPAQTFPAQALEKKRTAYFFLGEDAGGRFHGYPHVAIVVAEGLRKLGWHIASDVTAWRAGPDEPFLFPGGPDGLAAKDCDLLVVSEDFFMLQGSPALPAAVLQASVPAILLDRNDLGLNIRTLYSKPYEIFKVIYRTHGNENFRYPANLRQMVFGVSDRIAQASVNARNQEPHSRKGVIWNFRHTHFPHSVRGWAEKEVRPLLEQRILLQKEVDTDLDGDQYSKLMSQQTEGRHFPAYYDRMARAAMAACFGGWFLLPVPQREAGHTCMFGRRVLKSLKRPTTMIAQWDSWRMWEAFAAGTTVLHVDMSEYGFLFGGPRPEPMKHYIAFDIKDPKRDLALLNDPIRVREIGEAGRAWALEHYSSKPIATRILQEAGY